MAGEFQSVTHARFRRLRGLRTPAGRVRCGGMAAATFIPTAAGLLHALRSRMRPARGASRWQPLRCFSSPKYPTKDGLERLAQADVGTAGRKGRGQTSTSEKPTIAACLPGCRRAFIGLRRGSRLRIVFRFLKPRRSNADIRTVTNMNILSDCPMMRKRSPRESSTASCTACANGFGTPVPDIPPAKMTFHDNHDVLRDVLDDDEIILTLESQS
jgi:hypothetical protein